MEPETSKAVELIMLLDSWWSGVKAIWFRSIRWRLPVAKLTRTALLLHLGYLKSPSARCVILREVQRSWRLQNPTKTNHSGLPCNTGQRLRDTGVPTACTVPQPHPSVSCGAHALPPHWLECTVTERGLRTEHQLTLLGNLSINWIQQFINWRQQKGVHQPNCLTQHPLAVNSS